MDTYTYSTSNSASSSSSSYSNSSISSPKFPSQHPHEERSRKPVPAYRSALHSVRKIPAKNIITKKPIAPMPPIPPKIYKVDPVDFRDVVQRLTAAPEFQRRRLQEVAPPPLSLSPPRRQLPVVHHSAEMPLMSGKSSFDHSNSGSALMSPLGFSLSPSSLAWCSSMLLSPQTLSSLEQSAVL